MYALSSGLIETFAELGDLGVAGSWEGNWSGKVFDRNGMLFRFLKRSCVVPIDAVRVRQFILVVVLVGSIVNHRLAQDIIVLQAC